MSMFNEYEQAVLRTGHYKIIPLGDGEVFVSRLMGRFCDRCGGRYDQDHPMEQFTERRRDDEGHVVIVQGWRCVPLLSRFPGIKSFRRNDSEAIRRRKFAQTVAKGFFKQALERVTQKVRTNRKRPHMYIASYNSQLRLRLEGKYSPETITAVCDELTWMIMSHFGYTGTTMEEIRNGKHERGGEGTG